ncbi:MAG: hypothetical protein ACI8R8_001893, partial [Paraglaciecola sp.]
LDMRKSFWYPRLYAGKNGNIKDVEGFKKIVKSHISSLKTA